MKKRSTNEDLIANCYASLKPSAKLLRKYLDEVEKLENEGSITEDEFHLLKNSRVARNLLQEETLGEPDRFTEKTVEEILKEIRSGIKLEEQIKFNKEKEELNAEIISKQDEILSSKRDAREHREKSLELMNQLKSSKREIRYL